MSPQKIVSVVMLVSLMLGAGMEINREHLMAALKISASSLALFSRTSSSCRCSATAWFGSSTWRDPSQSASC